MDPERSVRIVRDHVPREAPAEASRAGLDAAVAAVLDTYRTGADGMMADFPLMVACFEAVAQTVGADSAAVYGAAKPRWLRRFRRPILGPPLGTLRVYRQRVETALSRGEEDPVDWQTVVWRRQGAAVAVASREHWYAVGGPHPYHDSETISILIDRHEVEGLVRNLRAAIDAEGGCVVDDRASRAPPEGPS